MRMNDKKGLSWLHPCGVALHEPARRLGIALLRNRRGVAYLEFALALPVLLTLGLFGAEVANMATINMQVSQMATSVADNASRIGQTDNNGVPPTVQEAQVDSVLGGAILQGRRINFEENGRVILSSLERDPSTGRQYIHWQRCRGNLERSSAYGPEGFGRGEGTLAGMGKTGSLIAAPNNSSVMFAEVYYRYQPIFGRMFVGSLEFKQEMAFETRDDRNLRSPDQPGITGQSNESTCAQTS